MFSSRHRDVAFLTMIWSKWCSNTVLHCVLVSWHTIQLSYFVCCIFCWHTTQLSYLVCCIFSPGWQSKLPCLKYCLKAIVSLSFYNNCRTIIEHSILHNMQINKYLFFLRLRLHICWLLISNLLRTMRFWNIFLILVFKREQGHNIVT